MSKHTPKPWVVVEEKFQNILPAWSVKIGEDVVPFFPYKRIYSEDGLKSAFIDDDEKHANIRLIASAPELLELVERAVKRLAIEHSHGGSIMREWIVEAHAAIAKATGEQQ